jgi:hypothetical protein
VENAVPEVTNTKSPYLIEREAASFLRYSVQSLQRWRSLGEGPKFKLAGGGRPLYLIQDLIDYVNSCQTRRKVSPNVGRPRTKKRAAK